jgi:hypothetical protein
MKRPGTTWAVKETFTSIHGRDGESAGMLDPTLATLPEWQTFYVITGSAAAALTGLMFVVIALNSRATVDALEGGVHAFGTPIVGHFCAVLLLAAVVSIPHQSVTSLALCLGGTGGAGVVLSSRVMVQARRQRSYAPVPSDWVWHVIMPWVAYALAVVAAILLAQGRLVALNLVAVSSLVLLFVGIRNAWDAAVYIATKVR